jgi:hypothetical protein
VLTVACFVCIELPRLRRSERMAISGPATIAFASGKIVPARLADLSVHSARLIGNATAERGEKVTLLSGALRVTGEIVRTTNGAIAVLFDDTLENRKNAVRFIYSQPEIPVFTSVQTARLGYTVLSRLFG